MAGPDIPFYATRTNQNTTPTDPGATKPDLPDKSYQVIGSEMSSIFKYIDKEMADIVLDTAKTASKMTSYQMGLHPVFNGKETWLNNISNIFQFNMLSSAAGLAGNIFYRAARPNQDGTVEKESIKKSLYLSFIQANSFLGNMLEQKTPTSQGATMASNQGLIKQMGNYEWDKDLQTISSSVNQEGTGYGQAYVAAFGPMAPFLSAIIEGKRDWDKKQDAQNTINPFVQTPAASSALTYLSMLDKMKDLKENFGADEFKKIIEYLTQVFKESSNFNTWSDKKYSMGGTVATDKVLQNGPVNQAPTVTYTPQPGTSIIGR